MTISLTRREKAGSPPPLGGTPREEAAENQVEPGTILIFMQDLKGGGAERVALLLANRLAHVGHRIVLVLVRREGRFLELVSPKVELLTLKTTRTALAPLELRRIIGRERPDIVLAHLTHVNVAALLAGLMSGRARRTVVVEHNQFDRNYRRLGSFSVKLAYRLARFVYRRAGAVVSVSEGVQDSLERAGGVRPGNGYVIYNPIVHEGILRQADEPTEHPWLTLDRRIPVIVAAGRLTEQKDYPTLLRALGELNARRPVRAIICGEGPERLNLEALIGELGLSETIELHGFTKNPFALMRAADAFVLSSRWEGLPTVLVEAMATGATPVATDCPSGPREILMDGKLGYLAEPGNPSDLADKIEAALVHPVAPQLLRERAEAFSVDAAIRSYCLLFDRLSGAEVPMDGGGPP